LTQEYLDANAENDDDYDDEDVEKELDAIVPSNKANSGL
jgi:hypothetical protein